MYSYFLSTNFVWTYVGRDLMMDLPCYEHMQVPNITVNCIHTSFSYELAIRMLSFLVNYIQNMRSEIMRHRLDLTNDMAKGTIKMLFGLYFYLINWNQLTKTSMFFFLQELGIIFFFMEGVDSAFKDYQSAALKYIKLMFKLSVDLDV